MTDKPVYALDTIQTYLENVKESKFDPLTCLIDKEEKPLTEFPISKLGEALSIVDMKLRLCEDKIDYLADKLHHVTHCLNALLVHVGSIEKEKKE